MQSYSVLPSSASRHCLHPFCMTVDSPSDLPFFFGFILIRLRLEGHGAVMCLVICTDIHINIHARTKQAPRSGHRLRLKKGPLSDKAGRVRARSLGLSGNLFVFLCFFFHSIFFFILFFPLSSRHVPLQEETFEGRPSSSPSGHLSPGCHPTASPVFWSVLLKADILY